MPATSSAPVPAVAAVPATPTKFRKSSPAAVSRCGTSPATRRMRQRLLALPFPAFALTVSQLLSRLGYENVTLRGVTGKKGRNSYGGLDIEATVLTGLTRSRVICQLRQYEKEPVPRQNVDVLRGAMLRLGADQGLLVTTSGFSPSAVEAAQAAQHIAPVRLIDGNELAMLLLRHNLLSEQAAPQPAVRAVPTTVPAPAKGDPLHAVQAEVSHDNAKPPVSTQTPPPPKRARRGIAITIVLSPLSDSSKGGYQQQP